MHLYLVRHAKAGSRHEWDGPDHLRPLSKKGRRQAGGLVKVLFDRPISRVVSSPFVRCTQTLEPLAEKLGLQVESDGALAEGSKAKDAIALVRRSEGAVLCTHGDLIPKILDALVREDQLQLPTDYPYAKGSTWELVGENDRYMQAHYIPPST